MTRWRAILAVLFLSVLSLGALFPGTAAAAPAQPDGAVFTGHFFVDYIGVDEAAARQVLEAGTPIMQAMDRFFATDVSPSQSQPAAWILVAPADQASRLVPPASDAGVLPLTRSGDGWTFSHQSLVDLMARAYLRPHSGPAPATVWSDGLAVLADPASALPLAGYHRPADGAAFIEDLRTFAYDLDQASALRVRQASDFFGAATDARFYRYQAAALVASVIQGGHARSLVALSKLSDLVLGEEYVDYQTITYYSNQLGLTQKGLDPNSISAGYLKWFQGADPSRLGNSVAAAVRRGKTEVWSIALAGIALAAAIVAAAMTASGGGLGVRDRTGVRDRLGVLGRTIGLYAIAAAVEYWVGVSGAAAGSPLAALVVPLQNLFELALIAVVALAVRRESRRRTSGTPGALQDDSFPRATVMAFGLFAALMAVRLAVYSDAHLIFGKATTILLIVLWVLHYERARLTEVGLSLRRLGAQLGVGFFALLAFRAVEVSAWAIVSLVFGREAGGYWGVWWLPTPPWQILAFLYGNFAEELFFRGYIQAKLDRAARTKAALALALAVQALFFGLYHVNYDLFPYRLDHLLWYIGFAASFGVVMGLIYRATGSVAVTAFVHPLWNMRVLAVGLTGYRPSYDFLYYPLVVVLAFVIIPPAMKRAMAMFGEVSFRDPAPALRKEGQPGRLRERLAADRLAARAAVHEVTRWPLERKLLTALSALSAVLILLMLTVIPVSGRVVLVTVVVAIAAAFGAMGYTRSRFKETLADLAKETGFTHIARPEDEVGNQLISGLHWSYPPDIYDLKIEGGYPYVVGHYRDFTVMVRRPRAVEFELNGPDTTRIAVYHRSKVRGLTVYSVRRYPRTLRLTPTGDEEFDRRFKVQCRDLIELRSILDDDVRRRLVDLDRVGVTGLTINPQGLFFYEPGLVTNAADLREILELLAAMAARVAGLRPPGADMMPANGPQ